MVEATPRTAGRSDAVLCVDDEPEMLEHLGLMLGRRYEVIRASSGADALLELARSPHIAVVLADLRMPGMDGIALLREVRRVAPYTTRVLVSGQADVPSFLAAVNEAEVFRLILKPVALTPLLQAVEAAAARRRQLMAERAHFATGLRDGIAVLVEVLANACPVAFGRALRLRDTVSRIADHLGSGDRWALELAALLWPIGFYAVPREVMAKVERDRSLSREEQAMLDGAPAIAERLVAHMPGLDVVRSILSKCALEPFVGAPLESSLDPMTRRLAVHGGHVLRLAVDFDALEQRHGTRTAIDTIAAKASSYDESTVHALMRAFRDDRPDGDEAREIAADELALGMVLVDEIRTSDGHLFSRRGTTVTPTFLERVRLMRPSALREPLRVVERAPGTAYGAASSPASSVAPVRLP